MCSTSTIKISCKGLPKNICREVVALDGKGYQEHKNKIYLKIVELAAFHVYPVQYKVGRNIHCQEHCRPLIVLSHQVVEQASEKNRPDTSIRESIISSRSKIDEPSQPLMPYGGKFGGGSDPIGSHYLWCFPGILTRKYCEAALSSKALP